MPYLYLLILVFAAIFGAMVGSFLNVVIYRLPRESLSIGRPRRSFCPACGTAVSILDNIPILSYLLLGARCRFCGAKISIRYPLVEALTGLLFFWLTLQTALDLLEGEAGGLSRIGIYGVHLYLLAVAIVVTFIDIEFQIIPDEITLSGVCLAPLICVALPGLQESSFLFFDETLAPRFAALVSSFVGGLAGGGSLYLVGWVGKKVLKRDALGFGDVKYMAFIGALLGGEKVLVLFFLGCAFGSLVGIPMRTITRKQEIAFGPFLSMGLIALIFFDREIFYFLTTTWPGWVAGLL